LPRKFIYFYIGNHFYFPASTDPQAGEPSRQLATVEPMKMGTILRAEKSGVVAKLPAKPGDNLAVDAYILESCRFVTSPHSAAFRDRASMPFTNDLAWHLLRTSMAAGPLFCLPRQALCRASVGRR
jgi:hypothetical protein